MYTTSVGSCTFFLRHKLTHFKSFSPDANMNGGEFRDSPPPKTKFKVQLNGIVQTSHSALFHVLLIHFHENAWKICSKNVKLLTKWCDAAPPTISKSTSKKMTWKLFCKNVKMITWEHFPSFHNSDRLSFEYGSNLLPLAWTCVYRHAVQSELQCGSTQHVLG